MKTLEQKETTTDLTRKGTCIEFFSAYQDLDTDRMIGLCTPDATVDFQPLTMEEKAKLANSARDFGLL